MIQEDLDLVRSHIETNARRGTFREPTGLLADRYLVPGGFYEQLWDWDAFLTGIGLQHLGSLRYLQGSARNFLAAVDLASGALPGCLTPKGPSATLAHAKPVIIQMAWLSARADPEIILSFRPLRAQMEALCTFWTTARADPDRDGLPFWRNMMESGADNLPLSNVDPSAYSADPAQSRETHNVVCGVDCCVWLVRELLAFAQFLDAWSMVDDASARRAQAGRLAAAARSHLWAPAPTSLFLALHRGRGELVRERVWACWMPLLEPKLFFSSEADLAATLAELERDDIMSEFGLRSTSSSSAHFAEEAIIVPYSEWRGPVWIGVNSLLTYGLVQCAKAFPALATRCRDLATTIASRLIATLARDLRQTGMWHECYHSYNGRGLAADGFFSWNVLVGEMFSNIESLKSPFSLD